MLTERQILILSLLPKVGKRTIFKIARELQTAISDNDLHSFIFQLPETVKPKAISIEMLELAEREADEIIANSSAIRVSLLGYWNQDFPSSLKSINDPPVLIYVAGNVEILKEKKTVAIIGTREPSDYGYKFGKRVSELLTKDEFIVVSGLAKGCDTAAHLGCLQENGRTIAVLAHGLDMIYPKENTELAKTIVKSGGLLLSEYPVGKKPLGSFFIERDRLQSGLSSATIVIETDVRGGTMHTVKFTEDNNKILACLSHPDKHWNHPKTEGNKMLIREGRAFSVSTPDDILILIEKIYNQNNIPKSERKLNYYTGKLFSLEDIVIGQRENEANAKKKSKRKPKSDKTKSVKQALIWE